MSIATEQSALGAILLGGLETFDEVSTVLKPEYFTNHMHRHIYESITDLAREGSEIDILIVFNRCDSSIVDLMYVGTLAKECPTHVNAIVYAKSVRDDAIKINLSRDIGKLQSQLKNEKSCSNSIQIIQDFADSISDSGLTNLPERIDCIFNEVVDDIERAFNANGELLGLSTGFENLDKQYSGLQGGQVVVLAARPGMGKTTLALNIAENVAIDNKSVLVFSLEMSKKELAKKLLSSVGRIESFRLKTGLMNDEHFSKLTGSFGQMRHKNLIVDDTASISMSEMKAKARMVKRKQGLNLIVIDYIQLMSGKGNNRTEQIGDISRNIKLMAKELDVPIIALSQLSRDLEKRPDKRPQLSDLRESGAIEQDADIVTFIYRDEAYEENSRHKGYAEIITRKQRDGDPGTQFLETQLHISRFLDTDVVLMQDHAAEKKGCFE